MHNVSMHFQCGSGVFEKHVPTPTISSAGPPTYVTCVAVGGGFFLLPLRVYLCSSYRTHTKVVVRFVKTIFVRIKNENFDDFNVVHDVLHFGTLTCKKNKKTICIGR